jgi:hypothetical protein
MSRFSPILIAALLFLTACSDEKKPNNGNFKKAINQYLAKHGKACTSIGRDFPVDVPEAVLKDQYGTGSQMARWKRVDWFTPPTPSLPLLGF